MKHLPRSLTDNIVVQELREETLVYDITINKAYCLNRTLSIVYQACDGTTSFAELARVHNLTEDLIVLALDELKKVNLIDDCAESIPPLSKQSRREIIQRIGLSTVVAIPLISYLVAPAAAMAQSAPSCVPAGSQATATAPNTNGTGLLTCLSLASQKCCNVPPFAFQSSGPNVCDGFSCACTYDCM